MAGPIGFGVAAARGLRRITCPRCGTVMARSRRVEGKVVCKACKHAFEPPPEARARAPSSAKTKKR